MITVTLNDERVNVTGIRQPLPDKATLTDLRAQLTTPTALVLRGAAQLADADALNDGDVLTLRNPQ